MVIKLDEEKRISISGKLPSLQMPWRNIIVMTLIFAVMLYGYNLFYDGEYDDTSLREYINSMNENLTKVMRAKVDRGDLASIESVQIRLLNWTNTFNNRLDTLSSDFAKLGVGNLRSDLKILQKDYEDLKMLVSQLNNTISLHLNTTSAPANPKTTNDTQGVPTELQFQYKYPCVMKLRDYYGLGVYMCVRADCNRNVGWQQAACDCWATFSAADKYRC